jgi:hypothetical protein
MDHLAATPVAPIIAAADPEARKKIGACVVERLQCYADNDGGFRMPAPSRTSPRPPRPAYENLQGKKPREPSVRVAQYPKARYRGEDSEQLASERCSYQCRNLCRRSCVPMWRVMACPPYIGDASEQSASACCASLTSPGASFKVSARWSVCLHSSHCLSWWYASPK